MDGRGAGAGDEASAGVTPGAAPAAGTAAGCGGASARKRRATKRRERERRADDEFGAALAEHTALIFPGPVQAGCAAGCRGSPPGLRASAPKVTQASVEGQPRPSCSGGPRPLELSEPAMLELGAALKAGDVAAALEALCDPGLGCRLVSWSGPPAGDVAAACEVDHVREGQLVGPAALAGGRGGRGARSGGEAAEAEEEPGPPTRFELGPAGDAEVGDGELGNGSGPGDADARAVVELARQLREVRCVNEALLDENAVLRRFREGRRPPIGHAKAAAPPPPPSGYPSNEEKPPPPCARGERLSPDTRCELNPLGRGLPRVAGRLKAELEEAFRRSDMAARCPYGHKLALGSSVRAQRCMSCKRRVSGLHITCSSGGFLVCPDCAEATAREEVVRGPDGAFQRVQ